MDLILLDSDNYSFNELRMKVIRETQVEIKPQVLTEVSYQREETLFGAIKWWKEFSREKIGEELHISVSRLPETIIINGKEYVQN